MLAALGLIVFTANRYANSQTQTLNSLLEEKKTAADSFSEVESKAARLQTDISAVKNLLDDQTKFSVVLADIASVLPADTYITSIGLSNDSAKPVKLVVVTNSLEQSGVVRNALLTSNRIEAVDIQNVSQNAQSGSFSVNLVIAVGSIN